MSGRCDVWVTLVCPGGLSAGQGIAFSKSAALHGKIHPKPPFIKWGPRSVSVHLVLEATDEYPDEEQALNAVCLIATASVKGWAQDAGFWVDAGDKACDVSCSAELQT